jgi:hypothetical protein
MESCGWIGWRYVVACVGVAPEVPKQANLLDSCSSGAFKSYRTFLEVIKWTLLCLGVTVATGMVVVLEEWEQRTSQKRPPEDTKIAISTYTAALALLPRTVR